MVLYNLWNISGVIRYLLLGCLLSIGLIVWSIDLKKNRNFIYLFWLICFSVFTLFGAIILPLVYIIPILAQYIGFTSKLNFTKMVEKQEWHGGNPNPQ